MSQRTQTGLSLIGAVSKSNLSSDDAVYALLEIGVRDRFTGNLVETIRVANLVSQDVVPGQEGVTFESNVYQPMAFDINVSQESGEIPEVKLGVEDVTGIIRTKLDLYQGGVGSDVTLHIVMSSMLSEAAGSQRSEITEKFEVVGASIADRKVTLSLGAASLLANSFPRRRQTRDFCQWAYKGPYCKYAGAMETCSRTLQGTNGCADHENTLNFGGFPGIQARDYVR